MYKKLGVASSTQATVPAPATAGDAQGARTWSGLTWSDRVWGRPVNIILWSTPLYSGFHTPKAVTYHDV